MTNDERGVMPDQQNRLEVRCSLEVYSDTLSPREVTMRVGIDSTEERVKGQSRTGNPAKSVVNHQWIWQPDDSIACCLDDQLDAIWGALSPKAAEFRDLLDHVSVQLSIWIIHRGSELSLGWVLDRRHVSHAATFGAKINIDEYDETDEAEG
jgi:hypothetical protein